MLLVGAHSRAPLPDQATIYPIHFGHSWVDRLGWNRGVALNVSRCLRDGDVAFLAGDRPGKDKRRNLGGFAVYPSGTFHCSIVEIDRFQGQPNAG